MPMPASDFLQEKSSFGFHILSRRRDQIHSMESNHDSSGKEVELEAFQKHVCERFQDLASDDLLSVAWIHKLLDTFLCCLEEFKAILFNNNSTNLHKPPMDRCLSDFSERSVKALDVCNAIREGIEQIRQWLKLLDIVLSALDNNQRRITGEAHFRRAKKALVDLAIAMLEQKDTHATTAHRNRSFGRSSHNTQKDHQKSFSQFRSLSWSVSRSWSAAKQLQAISTNIAVPRAAETASTNGLNVAVFTMNYVLLFVMWALVAAIPCQDRGLQIHFSIPKQFIWGAPVVALHEKIVEESKKRGRRNACGLLKEIQDIEICLRNMNELTDSIQFPLNEEKERDVKERVKELRVTHEAVKSGMDPLERHVREVFHRIVRTRTERFDSVGTSNSHE